MADDEDDVWIIFEGDIPLDEFLERNKPSTVNTGVYVAVRSGNPGQSPTTTEDQITALRQEWSEEWDEKLKSLRRVKSWIIPFHVRNLAKKYAYVTGKWLIYRPRLEEHCY